MIVRLIILFLLLSLGGQAQIIRAQPFYRPQASVNLLLDLYPNAAAAYSLRKVRSAYTGNCIKVRRKSDNTEQDIGFNGENLDTTALKNFVGTSSTDTGWVTVWYDQVSTRNGTQTTQANQPRIITSGIISREGSKPTLIFNGTTNSLEVDSIVNTGQIYFFSVVKPNINTGNQTIYGQANNVNAAGQIWIYTSTNRLRMTWLDLLLTSSTVNISTNLQLCTYYKTGVTSNWNYGYFRNTSAEGAFTSTSNSPSVAFPTSIGRIGKTGSVASRLNAELAEIIYYTSDQSSNRTGIESNINSYYSIY